MSRMIQRHVWSVAALAALCTVMVGCKTADPTVKNSMGTFSTLVDAEPPAVVDAVKAEFESMGLMAVEGTSTDLDGKVSASTAQDRKISVKVNREGENASRLKVHVTPVGDTDISMTIIQRVRSRLGGDK